MRHEGMRRPGAHGDSESVARKTASDLKMVAEDMLRMGRHWARAAQGWLERAGEEQRSGGTPRGQAYARSDRDLQSDYGGDGYDQVDAWRQWRSGGGPHHADQGAYDAGAYAYAGRDFGGRDYRGVGPRDYKRSDDRIREDLNERLTEAHDLDASGLSVEVSDGVATLAGRVPERWMKHRAEDLAEACIGVTEVRNQILVGHAQATGSAGAASGRAGTTTGASAGTPTGHAGSTGQGDAK